MEATREHWQTAGSEEQWSDSFYFNGGDADRGAAFYTRIGRRANEGIVEAAIGLWLPDGRFALAFAREDAPDPSGPVAAGGLSYTCISPGELWRVEIDMSARVWARAEDLGDRSAPYETLPLRGTLRYCAWIPPFAFAGGLASRVATEHDEQPGSVSGLLEVGDQRIPFVGAGMRDHSWGVRDWQAVPYWRWMCSLVDPDTFVLLYTVGVAGGGESAGGCVMLEGAISAVQSASVQGDQRGFVADVADGAGRAIRLEGGATSVVPLRQRRDGRLTLVNEGLTRVAWDGREVVAISEWLTQTV
jgi:hypothetical protein